VIEVLPMHESGGPHAGLVEVGEALGGELGAILGGSEQRLGVDIVVADARPRVRGFDAHPVTPR